MVSKAVAFGHYASSGALPSIVAAPMGCWRRHSVPESQQNNHEFSSSFLPADLPCHQAIFTIIRVWLLFFVFFPSIWHPSWLEDYTHVSFVVNLGTLFRRDHFDEGFNWTLCNRKRAAANDHYETFSLEYTQYTSTFEIINKSNSRNFSCCANKIYNHFHIQFISLHSQIPHKLHIKLKLS